MGCCDSYDDNILVSVAINSVFRVTFSVLIFKISGNVAFEKTASQGPNTDFTYEASYANDGDHNRNSGMRGCAWAFSPNMVPAWWEVDLGDDYVINYISVTTRDIKAKRKSQMQRRKCNP